MSLARRMVTALGLALGTTGCGDDLGCPAISTVPVAVTVVDATTDEPICDATVIAIDSESSYPAREPFGPACQHDLYVEVGSYTVTVEAEGYATQDPRAAVVTMGECTVNTVMLEYRLEPSD